MLFSPGRLPLLGAVVLGLTGAVSLQAQAASVVSPLQQACGVERTDFKMTRDGVNALAPAAPAGKALVYVIELMPDEPGPTTHVKLGVDGRWMGQLSARTFMNFAMDPGVHHVCARYEGKVAASEIDSTILHRLDVEAGKTYYLLYRGFITRDAGQVGFLDLVDEDEGQYVLQNADHVQATVVKR